MTRILRPAVAVLLPVAVFAFVPVAGSVAFAQVEPSGAVITLPGQPMAAPPAAAPPPAPEPDRPPATLVVPAIGGASPAPPASLIQAAGPGQIAAQTLPEDAPPLLPADPDGTTASWSDTEAAAVGADPLLVYDRPLPGDPVSASARRSRPQLSDIGQSNPLEGAASSPAADQALVAREPRRERPIDPARRAELTGLARTLGALHALRVSCDGRGDQTWRSRMATLLDLEAPASGTLRDPLVVAFNAGFQAGGRGIATCPVDRRAAEARLARQGRTFALALAARYRAPPQSSERAERPTETAKAR